MAHRCRAAVLAFGVSASGCFAYATPPLRIAAGVGPHFGRMVPRAVADDPAVPPLPQSTVTGRVGIDPLAMVPELAPRVVSVDAGYLFELIPRRDLLGRTRHGGFIGIINYPWMSDPAGACRTRVPVQASAEVIANRDAVGGGLTFTAGIELACFVEGETEGTPPDEALASFYLGEVGIGLEAGMSARSFDGAHYWVGTLNIVGRLPATAAVGILPVWEWL